MIIGIDPGITGAIAFLSDDGGLFVLDMPTKLAPYKSGTSKYTVNRKGKKVKKKQPVQIDMRGLMDLMDMFAEGAPTVYVEHVHAMPGQGVASMFSFGYAYGAARFAAEYVSEHVELVSPVVWKRSFNLDKDKKKSLELARAMFPNNGCDFKLVKYNGRAEAALIAHYGQVKQLNKGE